MSDRDRRPKKLGFTLIRDGKVFKTDPLIGNNWSYNNLTMWPKPNTLYGRQDVENMKIRKIAWSQWGSGDEDLSGLRLYPHEGEDS